MGKRPADTRKRERGKRSLREREAFRRHVVARFLAWGDARRVAESLGVKEHRVASVLREAPVRRQLDRVWRAAADAQGLDAQEVIAAMRQIAHDPRQRGSARVQALYYLGQTRGLWGGVEGTGEPSALSRRTTAELLAELRRGGLLAPAASLTPPAAACSLPDGAAAAPAGEGTANTPPRKGEGEDPRAGEEPKAVRGIGGVMAGEPKAVQVEGGGVVGVGGSDSTK